MFESIQRSDGPPLRERVDLFPYALISGAVAFILAVYTYPFLRTIYLAFTDSYLGRPGPFVGLQNFVTAFDEGFGQVIVRTAIWTFGAVGFAMLLGLAGALLLRREFRGRRYYMGLMLSPWALPLAVAGYLWLAMFIGEYGFINTVLFDPLPWFDPVAWLGPDLALVSVIITRIWKATPFALIIYYARLKSIPSHYYDAAKVDGAGKWAQFRYVTLPELKGVTVVIAVILTVWTTLIFDIVFVMTGGGPINVTRIIPVDIYITMFGSSAVGLAAAKSLITVGLLSIVTIVYWKLGDF